MASDITRVCLLWTVVVVTQLSRQIAGDSPATFKIDGVTGPYTVRFNKDSLEGFHSCLCKENNRHCSVHLEPKERSEFEAESTTNIEITHVPRISFLNHYQCHLILTLGPVKKFSLHCCRLNGTRKVHIWRSQVVYHLNCSQANDLECVSVAQAPSQEITVNGIDDHRFGLGVCHVTTLTPPETTTPSVVNPVCELPTGHHAESDADDSDTNIRVIISVVIGVIAFATLLVVVVGLLWKNRHWLQLSASHRLPLQQDTDVAMGKNTAQTSTDDGRGSHAISINESYMSADNRNGDCFAGYSYSSFAPDLSQDHIDAAADDVHGSTNGMTSEAAESTHTAILSSTTPQVYAHLHDVARDIQNPYDIMVNRGEISNPEPCLASPEEGHYSSA